MRLGIFSKIFVRATLDEALDAVLEHGFDTVQFNLASAGLPSMPASLSAPDCGRIANAFQRRGIENAVLSGTFNIIHPDMRQREAGFLSFGVLASCARHLGTTMLSVSTGTRNAGDMWAKHPDNGSPEVWKEMVESMARLAAIAEEHAVTIAFEPEQANVVDSAQRARALMDTLRSERVKVLMDAANLLNPGNEARQQAVLREAFELLGDDVVIAHAKEYSPGGQLGGLALGRGSVDFPLYFSLLRQTMRPVPVIMHGFDEVEVSESRRYLMRLSCG